MRLNQMDYRGRGQSNFDPDSVAIIPPPAECATRMGTAGPSRNPTTVRPVAWDVSRGAERPSGLAKAARKPGLLGVALTIVGPHYRPAGLGFHHGYFHFRAGTRPPKPTRKARGGHAAVCFPEL